MQPKKTCFPSGDTKSWVVLKDLVKRIKTNGNLISDKIVFLSIQLKNLFCCQGYLDKMLGFAVMIEFTPFII